MSKRIDVKNLDIYYGDFHAVKDVSMVIEPKSVTAFIGPSGCGKSTFIRTLNRMHEVIPGARVDGIVEMDGKNLYGKDVDPVDVRRRVGMVFQRPNPFPTMSIKENVLAGVRLNSKRLSGKAADELAERFPEVAGRTFCFVHIDVDLHRPTLDSIAFFYPRMAPGGIILLDDYGFVSCPGVTEAIDAFMADKPEPIVNLASGGAFILKGVTA